MKWRWIWCVGRIKGHQHQRSRDKVINLSWWEKVERGLTLTGGQGAGEPQAQCLWVGDAGGPHGQQEGHLGGTAANPPPLRCLCIPPTSTRAASHAPDLGLVLKTSSTDHLGFGIVWSFTSWTLPAAPSVSISVEGPPRSWPAAA